MGKIKTGAKQLYTDFFKYWDKPREGEYLSNKEFVTFCAGWTACDSVGTAIKNISFSASCPALGVHLGTAGYVCYR